MFDKNKIEKIIMRRRKKLITRTVRENDHLGLCVDESDFRFMLEDNGEMVSRNKPIHDNCFESELLYYCKIYKTVTTKPKNY